VLVTKRIASGRYVTPSIVTCFTVAADGLSGVVSKT
jgi:hypothetical protein